MDPVPSMPPASGCLSLTSHKARTFQVELTADLLETPAHVHPLADLATRRLLVCTTPTVDALYGASLRRLLACLGQPRPSWLVLPWTEATKTMESVLQICDAAQEHELDRKACLLAFGGGVCSDLVTVAASLVRRGISHVRLPTTLIGQVDAGIGIKGAANQGSAKNYLGCFHPPDSVVVAPQLLRSLPTVAMRQGMAEIAKIAVIRDRALFDLLQAHGPALVASRFAEPAPAAASVLVRAIAGMLAELGANPLEDRSHARAVDFGHTISPILEPATGYELHHGLAVAIDMAFSAVLARLLGLIPAAEADEILALLLALDLPIAHPRLDASLVERAFASAVLHRGGALNLVMPTGIGAHTFVSRREEIGQATIKEALGQLNALASGARPVRAA